MENTTKQQASIGRTTTAYHEAGHAVVAELIGWVVDYVWVADEGAGFLNGGVEAGACFSHPGTQVPAADEIETEEELDKWMSASLRKDMAGECAEYLFYLQTGIHKGPDEFHPAYMLTEAMHFYEKVDALDKEETQRVLARFPPFELVQQTCSLLAGVWDAVEEIVSYLLKHGRVDGSFVRRVLVDHVNPGPLQ
jgi:hypothetical protein